MTAIASSSHALVEAYEDLRCAALAGQPRGAPGLAVLLNRGMRSWMEAWLTWTPAAASVPPSSTPGAVPPDIRDDVVMVLAGMALGREEAA